MAQQCLSHNMTTHRCSLTIRKLVRSAWPSANYTEELNDEVTHTMKPPSLTRAPPIGWQVISNVATKIEGSHRASWTWASLGLFAEASVVSGAAFMRVAITIAGAAMIAGAVTHIVTGRWGVKVGRAYRRWIDGQKKEQAKWIEGQKKEQAKWDLRGALCGGSGSGGDKRGKKEKYSSRDSTMFTYVGQGSDRMSVELCVSCVETNRLLRRLATDAGLSYDKYEPCSMCKDRIGRIACIQTGNAAPEWD